MRKKLYNVKLQRLVKEIYSFKTKKISGKKSSGEILWEAIHESGQSAGLPLLPVAFDFDVTFKVKLSKDAIIKQYGEEIDYWFIDAKSTLSERSVLYSARQLAPKGFSLKFATYSQGLSNESDMIQLLNPKKTAPIKFGYTFHFEEMTKSSPDLNVKEKLDEIISDMEIFLSKFETLILKDTKFYKITK
jgi:hypothetical protein